MSLRASIADGVPIDQVLLKMPPEYREFVDQGRLKDKGPFTVISFPGRRSSSTSIIDSATIERALKRLNASNETIVAVAHAFTDEAIEVLDKRGALRIWASDFPWTDAQLARVRER